MLVGLLLPAGAWAQTLTLPDRSFSSLNAYLVGTWKWERPEPRETMIMKFDADGAFSYQAVRKGLQHRGRFGIDAGRIHLTITETCNPGCTTREPPARHDYPLTPKSANLFVSDDERWERQ